jgi:H+/Cl- antiporter ClcA
MNKLRLLLSCAIVGILVANLYYLFETAVHSSINYVWTNLFSSQTDRALVVPLSVVGALVFFGLQHRFDRKSEHHQSHSLGGEPINPTLRNLGIILGLGYFSLVGGASLGPEAVLVPASVLVGTAFGLRLFRRDEEAIKALAAAAIMALMAAFFHSYLIGILSLFLVMQTAKMKFSLQLLVIAVIASISSYLTLNVIDPSNSYFNFPVFTWHVAIIDVLFGLVLIGAGYAATFTLKHAHTLIAQYRERAKLTNWVHLAIVAGLGVSLLSLVGGPLVEFTGNQAIGPLIDQAPALGGIGIIIIILVKLLVIGWSRAMGYRGGLIFPMIFIASALAALVQLYVHDLDLGVGLIAALIGILAAERKARILL